MTSTAAKPYGQVKVLFFAKLRDKMGLSEIDLVIDQAQSLEQFQHVLAAQYPQFTSLPKPVLVAINQAFADPAQTIDSGDEVAFFPPVTGG